VTGGAGFIGQRTARALAQRGYAVRILDSLAAPVHPHGEWPADLAAEFECLQGDVRARDDWLRALRGVQAVIHLAAYQDYLPEFSRFLTTNAAGTALLYELVVNEGLPLGRVVVASSQAVYGEGAYRCPEHGLQYPNARSLAQLQRAEWELQCRHCSAAMEAVSTPEAVVNPQNAYGISKLGQELVALHLGRRYGIPTVALRYSITQGAGQSFHNAYSGVCRIFTVSTLLRKPLPIYEDGQQRRDYVYVGDVVSANILALEDRRLDYETYNVGGRETLTVLEYARLVQSVAGVEVPFGMSNKFRVGDTRHIISDNSRLAALGWKQTHTVAQVVREYLEWAAPQSLPERVGERAEAQMHAVGAVRVAG
jgi:dTDP-L-rhamnose 4-epimerase